MIEYVAEKLTDYKSIIKLYQSNKLEIIYQTETETWYYSTGSFNNPHIHELVKKNMKKLYPKSRYLFDM